MIDFNLVVLIEYTVSSSGGENPRSDLSGLYLAIRMFLRHYLVEVNVRIWSNLFFRVRT